VRTAFAVVSQVRVHDEQGEVDADVVGVQLIQTAESSPQAGGCTQVARLDGLGPVPANDVQVFHDGVGQLEEAEGLVAQPALAFGRG
jgi:hypothetical protein